MGRFLRMRAALYRPLFALDLDNTPREPGDHSSGIPASFYGNLSASTHGSD
jgi:hypothetical protein